MGNGNNQLAGKNSVIESGIDLPVVAGKTTDAGDVQGRTLVGLITQTLAGGSTAITFTVAQTLAGTYRPLKAIDNSLFTITVDANTAQYHLDPVIFAGVRFLKCVFDQDETETLTLVTRAII